MFANFDGLTVPQASVNGRNAASPLRLMETPDDVTGPVNLGNPVEFTIRQLAEIVIEMIGASSKIKSQPLPQDDPKQRRPDISKAKSLLAWEPQIQLREGLKKTIDYFDKLLREQKN